MRRASSAKGVCVCEIALDSSSSASDFCSLLLRQPARNAQRPFRSTILPCVACWAWSVSPQVGRPEGDDDRPPPLTEERRASFAEGGSTLLRAAPAPQSLSIRGMGTGPPAPASIVEGCCSGRWRPHASIDGPGRPPIQDAAGRENERPLEAAPIFAPLSIFGRAIRAACCSS